MSMGNLRMPTPERTPLPQKYPGSRNQRGTAADGSVVRTLAALAVDPGLVLSTHVVAHSHL